MVDFGNNILFVNKPDFLIAAVDRLRAVIAQHKDLAVGDIVRNQVVFSYAGER